MKERILQLAHGEVDIPIADVVVYPASVDETVSAEYSKKADLFLQSKNEIPLKAFVYSTDHRVVLSDDQAVGTKCSIHYEVMCVGMKSGSVIEGAFQFVAQGQEFQVPYRFVVEDRADDDVLPMIDTLEHFAKIVDEDPQKGLKLFLSRSFLRMPFMNDAAAIALYEELALYGAGGARALEEFLCYLGAKEPVRLSLEKDCWSNQQTEESEETVEEVDIEAEQYRQTHGEIVLLASNRGFVSAELRNSAPFVILSQNRVHAEDFVDGVCKIPFEIDEEKIFCGDNEAEITITDSYDSMTFSILYANASEHQGSVPKRIEEKRLIGEAYDLFLELMREAKISTLSFGVAKLAAREEEREVDPREGADEETLAKRERLLCLLDELREAETEEEGYADLLLQLMHGYAYYINGRIQEFRLIMDAAYEAVSAIRKKDVELYCIYLYLRYLMKPGADQKETVSRLLKKYYVEQKSLMSILLMLLDVDDQLYSNDVLAYEMLREQYSFGCTSPMLYIAAVKILNNKPEKLKNLEGFELRCILYGAKQNFLSEAVITQIAQLALYEKEFRSSVFSLLKMIYESTKSKKILTALVCLLIVGQKKSPAYFHWYGLGIENDVRLTGVYENYLDSLPKDYAMAMPDQVLLFCADKDDLSISQREVLYDNIITYFEPESKMYMEYREQMEVFAIDQLMAGRYNKTLIRLYQLFLYEEMIDERIAQVLPVMLMAKEIRTSSPKAEWVIVRYPQLAQEYRLRMKNGVVCMPVYSDQAIILFEDMNQTRYGSFSYEVEDLMANQTFLDLCRNKHSRDLVLSVLDTTELLKAPLENEMAVCRLQMLLEMAEIHPFCKKTIISKLLRYYYEQEGKSGMDSFILGLDVRELTVDDRTLLIELLSRRGFTKETYDIMQIYGYTGVSSPVLLAVAKYVILNMSYVYDPFLLNICLELYRAEQYNAVVLSYLLRYFNGITDEMTELLAACTKDALEVQLADFPERLLGQMMFTGRKEQLQKVFHLYVENVDAKHLYMPLIQAYMSIVCHDYFANGAEADEEVFQFVEQRLIENLNFELSDICKIALLRYYSIKGILEKNRCNLANALLNELFSKGYLFAFYQKLTKHDITLPEQLNGKVVIEYRSKMAEFVRLERQIITEGESEEFNKDAESYQSNLMQKVYGDIFVETVTLFDGEELILAFIEEQGKTVLKKTELTKMDTQKRYMVSNSRFEKINQAAASRQMDVELEALLREITTADEMVKELFPLQ